MTQATAFYSHCYKPALNKCNCTKILTNQNIQLTLFIVAILAVVLGMCFLEGGARVGTVIGGGVTFALFLISKCCYASPATTGPSLKRNQSAPLLNSQNPFFTTSQTTRVSKTPIL